jgi:endoglucanase
MKKLIASLLTFSVGVLNAQINGGFFDFNDGLKDGWSSPSTSLNEFAENNSIRLAAVSVGPSYQNANFTFPLGSIDLTPNPFASVKVYTTKPISFRLDLVDGTGKATNKSPIINSISTLNQWVELSFDFEGIFTQSFPTDAIVNQKNITGINIYINPAGTAFTGNVLIDDLGIGNLAKKPANGGIPGIKVNQVGYFPNDIKRVVVSSSKETTFSLVSEEGSTVFTGDLEGVKYFKFARDSTNIADFSSFSTPGKYTVRVADVPNSPLFEIKDDVYLDLAKGLIKSYYFNRASTPLLPGFSGDYARDEGHPDNVVYVHKSAASVERPEGTVISAPKGWYDAGDYNKYIVNSGISTYTLMALYERFSSLYKDLDLNIPESGNSIPDLLDEIKWNVDWMLAMQDPNDGGVYFKLTSKTFTPDEMPSADKTDRYVVTKSTSAALNFAAVMATAYRVFSKYDNLTNFDSKVYLNSAYRAYLWAKKNPSIGFNNPDDIQTGGYGDGDFRDEFMWAATELYISSGDDNFYKDINFSVGVKIPFWAETSGLAIMSLAHYRNNLTSIANLSLIDSKLSQLVSTSKKAHLNTAYDMPFSSVNDEFYWGSNGAVANQSMVLLQNYFSTGDELSYKAAKGNFDYILGKNPLEYCFVTGFGTKSPMEPHHRPSLSDGVFNPVPGMVIGGPNSSPAADCNGGYSTIAALKYQDKKCSYSTNEIAINWNAPMAFVAGAMEAKNRGIEPSVIEFDRFIPTGVFSKKEKANVDLYPNPADNSITLQNIASYSITKVNCFNSNGDVFLIELRDGMINTSSLPNGYYQLELIANEINFHQKFVIMHGK